jgi:hypothetical protein
VAYRADPITQQDGSALANSNCRMASAAMGIDYHTLGGTTSTGKKMRDYSGDPDGGTTSDDAVKAWKHYGETLSVRDGQSFGEVLDALREGRLVHLDVWAATADGPCSDGNVGHTIAVAPEQQDGKWLVGDPWCKPPKWVWWSETKLRNAAEEWADRCGWRSASAGGPRDIRDIERTTLLRIIKAMMSDYAPGTVPPDEDYPGFETTGSKPCLWTCTRAQQESNDVAINTNGSNLTSTRRLRLKEEAGFYADAERSIKYGTLNADTERVFIGPALGTDSHCLLVTTSKPYSDGQDRPTIVYVTKSKCGEPYQVD